MKKLMVMAVVVMAAIGLRAATADWNFTTYLDDQFGTGVADASLAFYCGDDLMTTVNSDGGATFSFEEPITVNGGDAWKVVMSVGLTDDGESFSQFTKEYAFTMPTFKGSGDPADASALDEINGNIYGAFAGEIGALPTISEAAAAGWTAAPEPTSGLLLLIGVAGLALRRRRA